MKWFFLLIIFVSCSRDENSLKDSELIKNNFEASEVKDLYKILKFFDEYIISSENQNDLSKSYDIFFRKNLESFKKNNSLSLNIKYIDEKKLFNELDKKVFNEIWYEGIQVSSRSKDTVQIVYINPSGAYADFLKSLSKSDTLINSYTNSLINSGDILPTEIANIAINYNNFNTNDERIRLFLAIHYLTLNYKGFINPQQ